MSRAAMPAALARGTPNRLLSSSGSTMTRPPGVVIITVAWPTNVIDTVPGGGRGTGSVGAGAVPSRKPLERGAQVAHRQHHRQRPAQALAVLVVQLARALGEADAAGHPADLGLIRAPPAPDAAISVINQPETT